VADSLVEEGTTAQSEIIDPVTGQQRPKPNTSVAEDVIQRKGVYGRFAEGWFSKKGWSADYRRTQGLVADEKDVSTNVESTQKAGEQDTPKEVVSADLPKALEGQTDSTTVALLPKILQTTSMYFSSGNFFFSYDYDLSHSIGNQQPQSSVPLFKQFDPLVSNIGQITTLPLTLISSSGTNIL
jgi:hypothetical protein